MNWIVILNCCFEQNGCFLLKIYILLIFCFQKILFKFFWKTKLKNVEVVFEKKLVFIEKCLCWKFDFSWNFFFFKIYYCFCWFLFLNLFFWLKNVFFIEKYFLLKNYVFVEKKLLLGFGTTSVFLGTIDFVLNVKSNIERRILYKNNVWKCKEIIWCQLKRSI